MIIDSARNPSYSVGFRAESAIIDRRTGLPLALPVDR
jgi:hypothetical protein